LVIGDIGMFGRGGRESHDMMAVLARGELKDEGTTMLLRREIAALLPQIGDPGRGPNVLHELTEDCEKFAFPRGFENEVASLFDYYGIEEPDEGFLSALTTFLDQMAKSSHYAQFFIRNHFYQAMWRHFPRYCTLDFFRHLLNYNEMPPQFFGRTSRPFDVDQQEFDEESVNCGYRVVAHFCTANGIVQRLLDYWDEVMASRPASMLRFLYCFAELPFAFQPFKPVRERLLALALGSEDTHVRWQAIRLVGLFGSHCVAGMRWLLAQEEFIDYFRTVPDDLGLAVVLLKVLGGASRWNQAFRLFGPIREMNPEYVELFLNFTLSFIPSEVEELQQCAVTALVDSVVAVDVVAFLLDRHIDEVLMGMLDSDCTFRTKEAAMQCLCSIFTLLPPDMAVPFAAAGFFACLFDWFGPMLRDIAEDLIDAVRMAFQWATSNPDMAEWIELTVENDEINSLLMDLACSPSEVASYGINSDQVNARGLLDQFDAWRAEQEGWKGTA
jgi:hypothetical protein